MNPEESSFRLGVAHSVASIVVAALAPILGAIADRGGAKKKFLFLFAFLGIVMTGALPLVARGDVFPAIALFVLAVVGWSGANTVYDSLIVSVAREKKLDAVSALGFSLGYLGGGILFLLNVLMVSHPETFGLADKAAAVKASFVTVAAWWAVFSIPVLLFVKEPEVVDRVRGFAAIRAGLQQVRSTIREIRRLKVVGLFLLAYWLYIDGVDTIIRMAVDYGKSIGFSTDNLILALLIVQFVGFPAAIAFGKLGERIGAKRGVFIGIAVYVAVCVWGFRMTAVWEFYVLAVAVGLVQGGVQALSRSLFARMVPEGREAQFFGFYNMVGKYAAVIGPAMMSGVGLLTGSPRIGILSVIILLAAGAYLLSKVDVEEGRRRAAELGGRDPVHR